MSSGSRKLKESLEDRTTPRLDGRSLAVFIFIVSVLVAIVWFGHNRLETDNNPSTQTFKAPATSH